MTGTLLFLGLGMQEILFIALIVLLFFGGKKIPELMKGLGKGVKSFKEGDVYKRQEYGDKVPAILNKVDGKEKMTVFGMNPPTSEVAYQWEMFGFAVLQSLGIKADEL